MLVMVSWYFLEDPLRGAVLLEGTLGHLKALQRHIAWCRPDKGACKPHTQDNKWWHVQFQRQPILPSATGHQRLLRMVYGGKLTEILLLTISTDPLSPGAFFILSLSSSSNMPKTLPVSWISSVASVVYVNDEPRAGLMLSLLNRERGFVGIEVTVEFITCCIVRFNWILADKSKYNGDNVLWISDIRHILHDCDQLGVTYRMTVSREYCDFRKRTLRWGVGQPVFEIGEDVVNDQDFCSRFFSLADRRLYFVSAIAVCHRSISPASFNSPSASYMSSSLKHGSTVILLKTLVEF